MRLVFSLPQSWGYLHIYSVHTGAIFGLEDIVAFLRVRKQKAHINVITVDGRGLWRLALS